MKLTDLRGILQYIPLYRERTFVISVDGEEHPIQVNNPIVLKLGNRNRTIILKSVP